MRYFLSVSDNFTIRIGIEGKPYYEMQSNIKNIKTDIIQAMDKLIEAIETKPTLRDYINGISEGGYHRFEFVIAGYSIAITCDWHSNKSVFKNELLDKFVVVSDEQKDLGEGKTLHQLTIIEQEKE